LARRNLQIEDAEKNEYHHANDTNERKHDGSMIWTNRFHLWYPCI